MTRNNARHAAEVARDKTTERDAALVAWMAAERSLEALAEASPKRDANYSTAEYLAAVLTEDYFAAERARRVSSEVATQPDVTSAKEVEPTKSPAVRHQQQRLHQPSSSGNGESEVDGAHSLARDGMGGGVLYLVGVGLGGGTQS